MKKILFLIFFSFLFKGLSQNNSVLSNGTWYKFSIDTTGVFKIDASFLRQLGVNPNNINPKNIKIYGNGGKTLPQDLSNFRYNDLQENAIYVKGEEDNNFNNNDYILFYGVGPHSWNIFPDIESATHIQNIYSDKAYYFLTIADTPGKRITDKVSPTGNTVASITSYNDFTFYEKEERNLFAVGRVWLGEDFSIENSQNFSIPFENHLPNSDVKITVQAAATSTLTSSMQISANNQNITSLNFPALSSSSSNKTLAVSNINNGTFINNSDNININITYNNNGLPSAKAYLDYIEVVGKKRLNANGNQFVFRSFEAYSTDGIVEFSIENSENIDFLWDVSESINPKRIDNISTTGNTFNFKTNGRVLDEYVVLNNNNYYQPKAEGVVRNQNLHSLKDVEYIVITNNTLLSEAQRLANYHQTNSNLNTTVVTNSEIYNEFASGSPDITGIRDFIKHVYDNSSASKKLKYVCFFGDSSYDYKDRIQQNNNIVPTYHAQQSYNLTSSYVTDDYFVMVDDNEGNMNTTHTIDIASGRIPVSNVSEAKSAVNKILKYYDASSFGDWRNTITLIADDIDGDSDINIQSDLEKVADSIKKYKPQFNLNKLYADAFIQTISSGGERYPQVQEAITNAIEKGSLVLNYFGHGGESGLASERLLEIPQIEGLNNLNNLPLFITVTCEFSRFDNPLRMTAGERFFLNQNGGAVSMITTTREIFIPVGQRFNKDLSKYVFDFDNSNSSIAENLLKTKNAEANLQKYFVYYFGDPAMKLAIAQPNVRITKMNDKNITQSTDTLKALSKISFEGVVTDASNNVLPNFNGTLFTTIFDKPIDKQTLDNDNQGIVNTFDSQESKLFRGKASVTNGTFKFDFIVPKDIKIAYGKAKVSMYAENQQIDKTGANFDITVGGINTNAPEDTVGPEIQAFMNDESFVDGAETNTSPNLIIKLSDLSGINTSITAVDHDITAVLDGNDAEPIVLNDYYETALDDYTNGKVTYQLRDLDVGPHTLKIKAWDTYNNSSEITLNFVVVSDTKLHLNNVLNYPNPFVNYTEFWFNHNKPNEPLEVQVQIFTVSGKLIKTINQLVQTTGGLSRTITWNGLDDFGNKIGKGVYIYKLKVKTTTTNLTSEKYEKLVIL